MFKNENKNYKICGKDSKNNTLYFPKSESCPINYIEFTQSEKPSKENYNFITKKINSNTYMHYTNEYTEGQILTHLRISTNNPPIGNEDYYNELCHYLVINDICKSDKEYFMNDKEDLYGYKLIDNDDDNTNSIDIKDIKNKKIFLYKRSYIGINSAGKIGNEILYIKSFININQIVSLISYTFVFFIFFFNLNQLGFIELNIFTLSFLMVSIILNFITRKKYLKVIEILDKDLIKKIY